jgi:hypothetical protein
MEHAEWKNTRWVKSITAAEVEELKRKGERGLFVFNQNQNNAGE